MVTEVRIRRSKDEAHGMRKGLREFHQLSWKTKGIKGNYRSLTLSCIPHVFHSPFARSGQIAFCNQLGRITVKIFGQKLLLLVATIVRPFVRAWLTDRRNFLIYRTSNYLGWKYLCVAASREREKEKANSTTNVSNSTFPPGTVSLKQKKSYKFFSSSSQRISSRFSCPKAHNWELIWNYTVSN